MNKQYDQYRIGHARLGYYVACMNKAIWPESDEREWSVSEYLHSDGLIHSFAGDHGYFDTEFEAEKALAVYKGGHLPEDLFEI